ncbi:hypothetical protein D3C80_1214500 [compost metagenome]
MSALMRDLLPQRWFDPISAPSPTAYCNDLDCIANYLCEAVNPATPVARYFEEVGQHCSRNTQDKVLMALLALRETILATLC